MASCGDSPKCEDSVEDFSLQEMNKSIDELVICGRYIKFYDYEFLLPYPSSLGRFQDNFTINKLLLYACIFSIDESDDNPSTSTPVKARRRLACQFDRSATGNGKSNEGDNRRGTKHDLTPGSKQNSSQPKTKRFLVGKPVL